MRPKTYFKEGKWSIVATPSSDQYCTTMEFSAIQHKCKRYWRSHITQPINIWKVDVPICSTCHKEVPEEIMGLWTLHNWDAIQGMKNAEDQWLGRPGQVWEYSPTGMKRPHIVNGRSV